jgi:alginate O-acetyltransferase complex protein AlgI
VVFSSHIFLFYFLPLALGLYYLAPRRGKHLLLTAISYLFYGWANPLFVVLMATSTIIDYVCGLVISGQTSRASWRQPMPLLQEGTGRSRAQKIALAVSICTNLSLLGFFKYFNFGLENYNEIVSQLGLAGLNLDLAFRVTLPLGISFYTFQSMSYSIDVYRGHARAMRNIIDFACYVSMFPQLVAGPIIRFQEVDDQLRSRSHTAEKFARGVAFFALGLAKKVLIANACAKVADTVFDAGSASAADAWLGLVAYSFQIYFDFSAYSDMAIGLGLMLGFVFPKNFDSPYRAQSITDFWRRWHISLSTWLRDYLYVPLGGNRKGSGRTYVNLAMVMVIGGLWHGAGWNFLIWGAIHGGMLAIERMAGKDSLYRRLPAWSRVALTFLIVSIAWVFFRLPTLPQAIAFLGSLAGLTAPQAGAGLLSGVIHQPYYLIMMAIAAILAWSAPQTWDFTRRITVPRAALIVALLLVSVAVLATQAYNPFIYFIF